MKLLHVFIVVLVNSTVFSQVSGDGRTFSLEECLKIAAEKNYDIKTAAGKFQSQSASVTQAFGAYLPTISANMGYTRRLNVEEGIITDVNGVPINLANTYSMSATASYNLFNGFTREANYDRSQLELDAADYNFRRARQTVSYVVRTQYSSVLKAMQVSKVQRENFEIGKKEVERMKALYEAGRVPIASVYSQEADLGSREFEEVSSQNAENQAKAQLLTTLSLPPDQQADFLESSIASNVDDIILSEFRKEIGSYNAAVSSALKNRVDYSSAICHVDASKSSVTSAKGGYFPALNANGGWSWSNTEFDKFSQNGRYYIGMNLRVPIFDNFNTSTQVQIASIQYEQSEFERAQTEQRIRSEVQSAYFNLDAVEKQLDITLRRVKSATQNFEAVKERLSVGAATALEYQTANALLVDAKIKRINAVYGYFDAQSQVRYALGTLRER